MKELKIRKDRTPAVLRKLAKDETDARVTRRILAIANALSGMNRAEAASRTGRGGRRAVLHAATSLAAQQIVRFLG